MCDALSSKKHEVEVEETTHKILLSYIKDTTDTEETQRTDYTQHR